MSYATDVARALAPALSLPAPFAAAFDWLEAQGWGGHFPRRDGGDLGARYLSIYPPEARDRPGASHVLFAHEAGPPIHAPPPEARTRIASIARISGDGGTLALWRDDDGAQRIAVFDHGVPFVLTDDPLSALALLAMGYPEPAALGDASLTPVEVAARDGAPAPLPPEAFAAALADRFGLTLPDRAADLGLSVPPLDAPDPLRAWLDALPD